ncbi:IclR family transcriptional regulator [Agrococcus jejuensis]|uniref:DNA-binding transcriptional regulator, IclR family n=1 Tax=Agrococcus jejuensis TaxID=399736 RepID=A0A1G8CD68_9MICO|nr:IclR family transcriptional regulator [Agrococcus jejuensis]SDH43404.1 DNA-binding transcriptional regulator, IclR family [Agrococcus jejuensis]
MVLEQIDRSAAPAAGASEKTLRVLQAALEHPRFTDIVAEAGLAKATVHRILATLVEQEFIAGDADHGYRAGPSLLALAGRALASVDISSIADPIVTELVERVDCTVHVGVLTESEMVYVIRKDASKPYRMRSRVGLGIPLHSSGMGKAVLATWAPERVDALVAREGLPARTADTITTAEGLHEELARVAARGYAMDLGENEVGTVCVSAAIRDHTGEARYGLSISSIALEHPGTTIESLAPAAVEAAEAISRMLGAPGA